jgi:hypothetical protein
LVVALDSALSVEPLPEQSPSPKFAPIPVRRDPMAVAAQIILAIGALRILSIGERKWGSYGSFIIEKLRQ